jgi:hypothetical protein
MSNLFSYFSKKKRPSDQDGDNDEIIGVGKKVLQQHLLALLSCLFSRKEDT